MPISQNIQLTSIHEWGSLSEFLSGLGISKNRQKKFIHNKKLLKKRIRKKDILSLPINLLNINIPSPNYEGANITKITDNDNFFALSKPVKVHSLPLFYTDKNNLISFARSSENNADFLNVNKDSYEKGLLFRLDYETSGLALIARNKNFYQEFKEKIKKKKLYLAIVKGDAKDDFSYAHHIYYVGEKRSIGRVKNDAPKNSHLEGKKIIYDASKGLSLIIVKIIEGNRHQIRIQLSTEGIPILGDPLYGVEVGSRMYLHAFCYQFEYNGTKYKIFDENIKDLEVILNSNRILEMAHQSLLSF